MPFEFSATILWSRDQMEAFTDNCYSRGHEWQFDGGAVVRASSSPHVVPLPFSIAANVDPEEAFVASLSSCHMLFFLSIAAQRRYIVERYTDRAVGLMGKDGVGKMGVTKVTLRPKVTFSGEYQPDLAQIEAMHHQSHESCFIANSVKTEVVVEIMV